MSFFPYETISDFFEAEGDFAENLDDERDFEEEAFNQALLDEARLEAEEQDPRDAEIAPYCDESGQIDPEADGVRWFLNEEGTAYPYPERHQEEHYPNDDHTPYMSEEAADAAAGNVFEPCCYNSTRNFGTGEHEYGCPNY